MAGEAGAKVKPRQRLISAAARLYLAEGIHAVGVDRLSAEAAVSKRSLYQHFDDKYDIVEEMLNEIGPKKIREYLPDETDGTDPRSRILAVFDNLRELSMSTEFVGCPFVNIATELRDPQHVASQAARRFKQELTSFFARQIELAGIANAPVLAVHLTMLFDGACAHSIVQGAPIPEFTRGAVAALLASA